MPVKDRIRQLNSRAENPAGRCVLYWIQANPRADSNYALVHAAEVANRLDLPLLCFEELTFDCPLANDRLHTFALEGVPETQRGLEALGAGYLFHLRRDRRDPGDVLQRLAADAAAVVTDDYPTGLPRQRNETIPGTLEVACTAVDSSCVVPMSRMEKREYAAYTIRPKIRKLLPRYLAPAPAVHLKRRWKGPRPAGHTEVTAAAIPRLVAACDISHSIPPSTTFRGGRTAALRRLEHFLEHNLRRYAADRNNPTAHATSGLSPYLRAGFVSSLEVALAAKSYGEAHEIMTDEFLEELIVRRELSFNHARFSADPASLVTLPAWARATLLAHAADERQPCYSREQFLNTETHDPLWNATQREMRLRGKIHGYYRMYWGKKIIEWSPTCQDALETMVHIHDIFALDGRDPNTYTGILWCFGLHDRPWQERPVFGMVRYMSCDGMRRKTSVDAYISEIRRLAETGEDLGRVGEE